MINVVTHDGKFHPDEVYACALLNIFIGDELRITRTREEKTIKQAQGNLYTYVLDVGDVYDPSKNNFDHHQSTFVDTGLNGDVYSTCGLIWKKLRDEVDVSEFIKGKIDEFTIKVDRHDNGVEYCKEIEFISLYNYNFTETTQNKRFKRAYVAACTHLRNMISNWSEIERKEKIGIDALKNAQNGIIFCEERIGVSKSINLSDNLLLVTPRNESEYTICSLNQGEEIDFSIRCPAPIEWRGLHNEELCEASGLHNMVFCHKAGFITVVKGTKEDALKVANEIIKSHKQ